MFAKPVKVIAKTQLTDLVLCTFITE